jgi:hypothetical protein
LRLSRLLSLDRPGFLFDRRSIAGGSGSQSLKALLPLPIAGRSA